MRKKNNNNLNEHDVLSIFSATVMSPHSLCVDTLSSWERRLLLPFLASFCKNKNLLQIVFTQQYTALYYTNIWCHSPLIKCFNMKSYQVGTQSGACGEELGPQNNPDWAFLNRKKNTYGTFTSLLLWITGKMYLSVDQVCAMINTLR